MNFLTPDIQFPWLFPHTLFCNMRPHCLTSQPLLRVYCASRTLRLFRVIFLRARSYEISDGHCIQISMARKVETPRSMPRKSPTFVSVTGNHFFKLSHFIPALSRFLTLLENIRSYIYIRCENDSHDLYNGAYIANRSERLILFLILISLYQYHLSIIINYNCILPLFAKIIATGYVCFWYVNMLRVIRCLLHA